MYNSKDTSCRSLLSPISIKRKNDLFDYLQCNALIQTGTPTFSPTGISTDLFTCCPAGNPTGTSITTLMDTPSHILSEKNLNSIFIFASTCVSSAPLRASLCITSLSTHRHSHLTRTICLGWVLSCTLF